MTPADQEAARRKLRIAERLVEKARKHWTTGDELMAEAGRFTAAAHAIIGDEPTFAPYRDGNAHSTEADACRTVH